MGPYRLRRLLGRGGMGEVWEATGPGGGKVALKLLDAGTSGSRAGLRRFLDEARLGAALDHPNLVPVIDAGQTDDGFAYLAMERLEGRPLNTLLSSAGPRLPLGLVVELGLQALRALEAVHGFHTPDGVARPIIHRDLKPSNLFLTTEGRLKVIDFGIAAGFDVDRTRTGTGQGHGTVRYSSPEQAAGLDPDARTDLFAWGLVMHELLTGRLVFDQPNDVAVLNALVHQPIPAVTSRRPDVPAALAALLDHVLEKDRERRASSAAEVAQALEAVLPQAERWRERDVADWLSRQAEWSVGNSTATGDPVAPPAPEVRAVSPRSRRAVAALVAGAALLAVAALGARQL
ncbi:MAG: serine/threonine protein kinase, partial [Myxococcaceae bacterium]|nr:serine/threonine protein kinase [Myxococcaceae bacterium]